ncbi:MAG: 4-alpha-glucanotransferase [Dehalococcoidia bacterium]
MSDHPERRKAGVLLHPTSLPGPFGIGDLGPAAYHFVDFLASAGQRLWQVLPLTPPGAGHSPYAARSTFAGNPLLVSPELLRDNGLLHDADLAAAMLPEESRVPWTDVAERRETLLRTACARWHEQGRAHEADAFRARAHWLGDYALFTALRRKHRDVSWLEWPAALRHREPAALAAAREELAADVALEEFTQWCFDRQWAALRHYAHEHGVELMGDMPIFVDHDSADTWAHQRIFKLDSEGRPLMVAGVPPDAFSATGQRWGNPLYDWDALARDGYGWWRDRLAWALAQVDILRLDHFRGFEAAWEIPADEPTAVHGHWVPGPGRALFDALTAALGPLPVVAEDLGVITAAVRALCDGLAYPGMKVLQFAFGDDAANPYLPHNLDPRSVIYTGTHDNDTTAGWFASAGEVELANLRRYLACEHPCPDDLARMAYRAVSDLAILPMQDVLGLGREARMNVPGEPDGNWGWRFRWDELPPGRHDWLRELAHTYGRWGIPNKHTA